MTYIQTLDYLYSKLPMFTKIGNNAYKKDLTNTLELCNALDNPQNKFKSIHIGGTNGKGSISHILAAVLQEAGYKTGLYTSPHLKDFRERIKINGKMIPKKKVVHFVKERKSLFEQVQPSFFEATVAMAFDYFAKEKVDIAIIEVGLGGRLDSTNIIHPELSIISNISLDHTQILGDTLAAIAYEKAGIIKAKTPIIIGEHQAETDPVFIDKAKTVNAELIFAQDCYHIRNEKQHNSYLSLDVYEKEKLRYSGLKLDLRGTYQQKNILGVLVALQQLNKIGYSIKDEVIYSALKKVKKLTRLLGRWQTIQRKPLLICDTGHNEAGMNEVLQNIALTKYRQLHIVIGMVKDKDISSVLKLLPNNAHYYFCQPALERALDAKELALKAAKYLLKGNVFSSVQQALNSAKANAQAEDLIFVGGSTFVVAEIV